MSIMKDDGHIRLPRDPQAVVDEVNRNIARVLGVDLPQPTVKGVWCYGYQDSTWIAQRIFSTELAALRHLNAEGSGQVKFVPFGTDIINL